MVSIILCTYNRAHTLKATIDSILAQTYTDFELILVDDGSTDRTQELLAEYSDERIRSYVLEENSFYCAAANFGLTKVRGDYIAFPMELRKVPKEERRKTVKRLLEAVQLEGFEKRKIREMSGGQMQRVALARALAADPTVLLLDEPFSGLDEKLRGEMGGLVKKLHEEWKITTILVTHDIREALQMSDRIAWMDSGNILQYDTPQNMMEHPANEKVKEYFGRMNYVEGIVKDGRFKSSFFEAEVNLPDGEYKAGITWFRKG